MALNLKDIVELAKAGYKVSEVKELIALSSSEETGSADEGNEKGKDEKGKDEKKEEQEAGKEQPEEAPKKSTSKPEEDSSILSYKQKIEELEEKIKTLQSDNVHKDQSEVKTKSDEEIANELAASYM